MNRIGEEAARAWAAGLADPAQRALLEGEAGVTGEDPGDLAARVLRNAEAWRLAIARLSGLRRRHRPRNHRGRAGRRAVRLGPGLSGAAHGTVGRVIRETARLSPATGHPDKIMVGYRSTLAAATRWACICRRK